ncbi:hypothetical protein I3842_03G036600 [Carya illinoinensis]|uniref:Uncharacterized protein n=1 Tax=Carya illinoinensis TaxID=32201 RepID=A0A922FC64_CARIL|nr:hypothetical protein I3842_03G036600 [Carya illinoinensis]KAG6720004.1 hypothetical protein I3842_03G036600 [Carya illinoinensis]KAG6720005.1 hypothetical protein I3842_03G036600 [Carya illinoinensis]
MESLPIHPHFTVTSHRPSLSETTRAHLSWRPPKFLEYTRGPVKINYLSRRMCLSNTNGGIKRKPHEVGERDGVIIVDHGSRRKESNLMLRVGRTIYKGCLWFLCSTRCKSSDCKPIFSLPWMTLASGYSFLDC